MWHECPILPVSDSPETPFGVVALCVAHLGCVVGLSPYCWGQPLIMIVFSDVLPVPVFLVVFTIIPFLSTNQVLKWSNVLFCFSMVQVGCWRAAGYWDNADWPHGRAGLHAQAGQILNRRRRGSDVIFTRRAAKWRERDKNGGRGKAGQIVKTTTRKWRHSQELGCKMAGMGHKMAAVVKLDSMLKLDKSWIEDDSEVTS